MKKHYNITHLTDELSNSVFFQKPEQTEEPEEKNQSTLAPKHQGAKALSNDSAKPVSNQSSLQPNDQSTKEQSNQRAQETKQQSTVARKHFSSYLEPGTYKAWKLLATQREKKDYEILQEAVEQYLARQTEEHP
jgi:hypothetical protein